MEYEHPGLIKYELQKIGEHQVSFQILEQHPTTVSKDGVVRVGLKNGMKLLEVGSSGWPEITSKKIWLRGRSVTHDLVPAVRTLSTASAREDFYNQIVASLAAWAELPIWESIRKPQPKQLELW